jgi:hypothetical protein
MNCLGALARGYRYTEVRALAKIRFAGEKTFSAKAKNFLLAHPGLKRRGNSFWAKAKFFVDVPA